MKPIVVNADRPALEIARAGVVTKWEYDVLTLKMEIERLESVHKLTDGKPTSTFLAEFAAFLLTTQGLEECTIDLAMRIHSIALFQFKQLALSIASQIEGLE